VNDLLPATGLRWLYVDFNSYFASVEQQLQPHLRGKPVAIVPVETNATCAIAASYEAKAFGIKTGTPIWEAKRLCPNIICVLAQHARYVEYHHRICAEVAQHIPVTAVCSIDEVACRLMNNETTAARACEIAYAIKYGLARHVGAYVATDMQKPNGLVLLRPSDLPQRLLGLKPSDLPGIGRHIAARLALAGIHDIAALWALDAPHMRRIWGSVWGERLWYLLRGADLPEAATTRRTVGHSHVMAPKLREPAKARYVARRLTLKAAARLRRMDFYARALCLAVHLENGAHLKSDMCCYRAQDSMTFLHVLPAESLQPELFAALPNAAMHQRAKDEKLSRVLDQINQRFGRDAVLVGMLPAPGDSFSGSKIAFTRIPDREEFSE
jgi:DNA polymerase-4